MFIRRGFLLTVRLFVKVGQIIGRAMVEVAYNRYSRGASVKLRRKKKASGNSTSRTTVGGSVEVGPNNTSGRLRSSSKESEDTKKKRI